MTVPKQEFYLLQIKVNENGEWHECRNSKGNVLVFLTDFDAINYSSSEEFNKLSCLAIETRLIKHQVLRWKKGVGLS